MEEEIEDIVGDVKLTDSQKSVATSNVYSMDFTDYSSDRNNSSGKDTYVIEYDSDESDIYPVHEEQTVIDLKEETKNKDAHIQCEVTNKVTRTTETSVHNCIIAQEIFTQTSKTIFELAQTERIRETLETQTSFVSFTQNRTFEYRTEIDNDENDNLKTLPIDDDQDIVMHPLENESSKFAASEYGTIKTDENRSEISSEDRIINILDTESKENVLSDENHDTQYENTSDFDESINSDIEQDSLSQSINDVEDEDCVDGNEKETSIDSEIDELCNKVTGNSEQYSVDKIGKELRHSTLTPLTEESTIRRDSILDIAVNRVDDINKPLNHSDAYSPTFNEEDENIEDNGEMRLPPIQNKSCPSSPHLNFLFSVHPSNRLNKMGTLPCLYEASEKGQLDIETRNLACGECPVISGRSDPIPSTGSVQLPPIRIDGYVVNSRISRARSHLTNHKNYAESQHDCINIKEKIKDLKMSSCHKMRTQSRYQMSSPSRSVSPGSDLSPMDAKLCDVVERGCDALCTEMLRRLRFNSWLEVTDTLDEMPKALEKFWGVITENRIADLIRQVSTHVDSPRTQVAKTACSTLAAILKNTNYTKKPDFHEAMSLLVGKTGSFSRPVRRAANMALDAVVCAVELTHAVTALAVHAVHHKSPLVRSAVARLLVVACAVCGGGRGLLRARPPSAAAARRLALRALAGLLDDKTTDARKYAERLYVMLRPLANFEAYYLTDVDVQLATTQMRKYDRLLQQEDR